jgi:hypothetical protein
MVRQVIYTGTVREKRKAAKALLALVPSVMYRDSKVTSDHARSVDAAAKALENDANAQEDNESWMVQALDDVWPTDSKEDLRDFKIMRSMVIRMTRFLRLLRKVDKNLGVTIPMSVISEMNDLLNHIDVDPDDWPQEEDET